MNADIREAQRLHLEALKAQLEAAQALTDLMRRQYEDARRLSEG